MLKRRLWGFRMNLKRAEEVLCEGELELSEFIRIVSSILRNGGVSRTIAIDSNGRVIENAELCITLKKIGVKYIPISNEVPEEIFIPLESLGFFEDISPNKYRVVARAWCFGYFRYFGIHARVHPTCSPPPPRLRLQGVA